MKPVSSNFLHRRANYLEQMVGRPEVKLDFRKLNWIGSFNRPPNDDRLPQR